MNFEHFKESFDLMKLNQTISIFKELLARHIALHQNHDSTVLLLRSLTSELIYVGIQLSASFGEFVDFIDPDTLPPFVCSPNLKRKDLATVDNSDTRSVGSVKSTKSCKSGQNMELNKKKEEIDM